MKTSLGNSSDLDLARVLAERLSGGSEAGKTGLGSSEVYADFPKAARLQPREPSAAMQPTPRVDMAPGTERIPLEVPPGADSWDELLNWCCRQVQAEAGFIVNSQGFVISMSGREFPEGFDSLGAELYLAFEELERLDAEAGRLLWIDLEYAKRRLVSLRARDPKFEQALSRSFG